MTPDGIKSLADLSKLPFTSKQDFRDKLSVGPARGADGAGLPRSCVQRDNRQTGGSSLHSQRPAHVDRGHGRTRPALRNCLFHLSRGRSLSAFNLGNNDDSCNLP